jgi:hypothetical protein
MLANRTGGRHGAENLSQPIDKAALLVDTYQWLNRKQFPHTVNQTAQLLRAGNIAAENDNSAGLYFLEQVTRLGVEFCARKTDEEKLSYLLFEGY